MSSPLRRFIFLLASETQIRDAACIRPHLTHQSVYIDLRSISASSRLPDGNQKTQLPETSLSHLLSMEALLRRLRIHPGDIIVTGQDIGRMQRRALAHSTQRGARTALIPDGIVFAPGSDSRGLKATVDLALRRLAILRGHRFFLGGSQPDLICSWGPGWGEYWNRHADGSDVVVTGSPRSDLLSAQPPTKGPPRILIASQPLWQPPISASIEIRRRWQSWLERQTRLHADSVRVRLHPLDLKDSALEWSPTMTGGLGRSVSADLNWASHVLAPASTILLEASALGRQVALLDPGCVSHLWSKSPYFDDKSWTRLSTDTDLSLSLMDSLATDAQAMADRYLVNVGNAGRTTAGYLEDLMKSPGASR